MANLKKLRELQAILQEAGDQGRKYNQAYFYLNGCPSCALAYWAERHPETWEIDSGEPRLKDRYQFSSLYDDTEREFQLTKIEHNQLFLHDGMAQSCSATEAALFLHHWLKEKEMDEFFNHHGTD